MTRRPSEVRRWPSNPARKGAGRNMLQADGGKGFIMLCGRKGSVDKIRRYAKGFSYLKIEKNQPGSGGTLRLVLHFYAFSAWSGETSASSGAMASSGADGSAPASGALTALKKKQPLALRPWTKTV